MLSLMESGHIQVYFNDPDAQKFLAGYGWDGGIDPGDGDFFSLIDSNVGFNKADALVQREVRYRVDLRDIHHPTGEITAAYHHNGKENGDQCKQQVTYGEGSYQDMQQRCYFDYWRIYSPGESRLISSRTEPVPGDQLLNPLGWSGEVETSNGEMGTQVWAGLLVLPRGETRDFKLEIELSPDVIKRDEAGLLHYQLCVQKQPGLEFLPFKLEITLPDGYVPVVDDADWQKSDLNSWIWEENLIKRTEIDLVFQFESIP
jgi:hypothetical protein